MIFDRARYRDGERVAEVPDLSGMANACRDRGEIARNGLYRPTAKEFTDVEPSLDAATLRIGL